MPSAPSLADWFPPGLVEARLPALGEWSPVPAPGEKWPFDEATRARVLGEARAAFGEPWPALPASLFARFARDGDRAAYQAPWDARRARLGRALLALAAADGADDGAAPAASAAFADEVMDGVWALCEETSWVWPAHDFRVLDARQGLLPDPEVPTLDLGAATTAVLLSLADALAGDALDARDPLLRRRLRGEVWTRVLGPYLERSEWGWYDGSTAKLNNWNPWIHSDLLLATALTVEDRASRAALVGKIVRGLDHYLAAQPADGGCDEGPHYWWRAGASLFECLELLISLLGTGEAVLTEPLIRDTARYPLLMHVGDGWSVSFADGPARLREATPAVLYRYGLRTGQPDVAAHARALRGTADPVLPEDATPYDLRRVLGALLDPAWRAAEEAALPLPGQGWLPGTQVLVAREAEGTTRGLLLAAKGGHNDESHNHNDVGSFLVAVDARPLIIDVGVGTYRRETFGRERYGIWSMTSAYHNVPEVNGHGQPPGRDFAARGARAELAPGRAALTLDLAGAYPARAGLRAWERTAALVRGEEPRVEIRDAWRLDAAPERLVLHLLLGGEVTAAGAGRALVRPPRGRGLALAWDDAAFAAEVETVVLEDPAFTRMWGEAVHRLVLTARAPRAEGTHVLSARPAD
ncbi:heparinase II/III domain-containing protein [Streptomyces sp. CLI2509]|uniref:heparinase II/III domain-containing protein n=1 Tax=Streptomyces sp. CLI2509 TaxID=1984801 RepID=UPI000BAC9EFD|nr:heparinase II/III family protein [Streptomyces sp. CLI2509]ASY31672.1 heparinase [Streptomyces sp. CLI2509]